AAVASGDGNLQGVYLTKDFGQTWTRLQLPYLPGEEGPEYARPSNNLNNPDYFAPDFPNPQYTLSLTVDPNHPELAYLGGSSVNQTSGLMRIDASRLHDAHALIAFHHSRPDGGQRWLGTNAAGAAVTRDLTLGLRRPARLIPPQFTSLDPNQYTNLIRDPD